MIELHPSILRKNGKEEFVVLPYEEFVALQELLADAEDVLELRSAKQDEQNELAVSLKAAKDELGLI